MGESILYKIEAKQDLSDFCVREVARPTGDWDLYAGLIPMFLNGHSYLFGFDVQQDCLVPYDFIMSAPWLVPRSEKTSIGTGRNLIGAFVQGNRPYLSVYTASSGIFEMYSLMDDISLSKPVLFYRNHEPAISQGFTTLKFFTCFGQVVFLGYNAKDGHVALYTIRTLATSPSNLPPIAISPVWSHQWAQGWTRFAFFQFGGENFFIKTNTWRPNVNIDHIHDSLGLGTVEVATHMELEDAQDLSNVETFQLGTGNPHFVTYLKDAGLLRFYRFHGDCNGWDLVGRTNSKVGAGIVTPISMPDGQVFLLVG